MAIPSQGGSSGGGGWSFPRFFWPWKYSILLKFVGYGLTTSWKKQAQFYFKMQKSSLKLIPWDEASVQLQDHVRLFGSGLPNTRGFKTQGNSKSIYNESILRVCHFLRLALDTCGEFKRCYLKDHVEETIFTCINYWRAVNLSCSSGIKLLV